MEMLLGCRDPDEVSQVGHTNLILCFMDPVGPFLKKSGKKIYKLVGVVK